MIGGVSWQEIGFVALLVAIVELVQLAPRIGEAIGGLFERGAQGPKNNGDSG